MSGADAFALTVHAAARILEVRYPRKVTAENFAAYEQQVRQAVAGFAGPFRCLVDMRPAGFIAPELAERAAALNRWAAERGMDFSARVVDTAVGELQGHRIRRTSNTEGKSALYPTREAAWAALEALPALPARPPQR